MAVKLSGPVELNITPLLHGQRQTEEEGYAETQGRSEIGATCLQVKCYFSQPELQERRMEELRFPCPLNEEEKKKKKDNEEEGGEIEGIVVDGSEDDMDGSCESVSARVPHRCNETQNDEIFPKSEL